MAHFFKKKLKDVLSYSQLYEDYVENHKTDKEIAEKYGFNIETLRKYRNKLGINRYVISKINEMSLTNHQKEIINGTILGDGYISPEGVLEITHSNDQYSYIYWMSKKLYSILAPTGLHQCSKNKHRFRTKALDYLKNIRKFLYPNGKKIITREFLNELTPLSLAVWFQDDAYVDQGSNYILCTQGFDDPEREIITSYFKDIWEIETNIHKYFDKKYQKWYFCHRFNHENSVKLTKIIKYHLLPCMLYKLLKSERNHVVYLAGGMQKAPDGGVVWRRKCKQILNQRGYYCIDPTKEENCLLLDKNWKFDIENNFPKFQKNMREIIKNDLYFVNVSDHIVCSYDDFIGGGTFHEIGESYLKNKNLYLLNFDKIPLSKLNWWALGCCTKVINSLDELLEQFNDISNEPYVPYHKS